MSRYWSPLVARLHPYVPGEQPAESNLVKLNTNESPYGPSPRVLEALRAELDERLRLYPPPESDALRDAIAHAHGLSRENVFVGNGSDEVLAHAFLGLMNQPEPILLPDITYSFYPVYCGLYGIRYETVSVDERFAIDPAAYARPNGGIVFANPNAPTGCALLLPALAAMAQASRRVVLVDEAYVDFGAASAVSLLPRHDNVLVVRTFSKSRALAGLRLGYALGHPELIEALTRVKNSFNSYPVDRLAQVAGIAALEDVAYFEAMRDRVIASRERLAAQLSQLGFEVLPSATNFLFARHLGHDAKQLTRELRARKVLVRHFDKPRIAQFLRITVGTDAQCDALVSALAELV